MEREFSHYGAGISQSSESYPTRRAPLWEGGGTGGTVGLKRNSGVGGQTRSMESRDEVLTRRHMIDLPYLCHDWTSKILEHLITFFFFCLFFTLRNKYSKPRDGYKEFWTNVESRSCPSLHCVILSVQFLLGQPIRLCNLEHHSFSFQRSNYCLLLAVHAAFSSPASCPRFLIYLLWTLVLLALIDQGERRDLSCFLKNR